MATALLIKVSDIPKLTPLGGNIDADKYVSVIKESQVFVIEPILGTKLYKKIVADNDAQTITGVYSTILEDYIKPILAYTVASEYITIAAFNVGNGGIYKHSPENAQPVDKNEIDFLASKQRAKVDVYIERLQRFLCDTANDIPEYTFAQDNNYDIDPDKNVNTFGGWRLSGRDYNDTNAMRAIWRDIWNDQGR